MTQEAKVTLGIISITVAILIGAVFFLSGGKEVRQEMQSVDVSILTRNVKHTIQAPSAKVTIVEFGDYQCPACGNAHPVMKQILEEYKGQVAFVYRHFPLPQHNNAVVAAKASEAAGEQGKFWEMHDLLYTRQSEWSEESNPSEIFKAYAKELELDTELFAKNISGDAYKETIEQDKNDGIQLGVNSTPTIFINNKKLIGPASYENIKRRVLYEFKLR